MTARSYHSVYRGWRIYAPPTTHQWSAHRLGEPPIEAGTLEALRRLIDEDRNLNLRPVSIAKPETLPVPTDPLWRGW